MVRCIQCRGKCRIGTAGARLAPLSFPGIYAMRLDHYAVGSARAKIQIVRPDKRPARTARVSCESALGVRYDLTKQCATGRGAIAYFGEHGKHRRAGSIGRDGSRARHRNSPTLDGRGSRDHSSSIADARASCRLPATRRTAGMCGIDVDATLHTLSGSLTVISNAWD